MLNKNFFVLSFLTVCLVFAFPIFASAATFRASNDGTTTVSSNEKVKNLYIAGNNVNSDGTTIGDIIAAGSNINLNGKVEQSVLAAGSNLNIRSDVGSNIRVAGGTIYFDGKTGGDFFAAGGTITLADSSLVAGDIAIAGGQITIDGDITGNAWITGGDVTINGKINGNVLLKNVTNLKINDKASIGGNLTYYSPNTGDISSNAVIAGNTEFKETPAKQGKPFSKTAFFGALGIGSFAFLLITFITLLLIIYIFPRPSKSFSENSLAKTWDNLGIGLASMIVVPIAGIILFFSIVGSYVGGFLFGFYLLAIGLAKILSVILIGYSTVKLFKKEKIEIDWLVALVGSVGTLILGIIPIVGWIILLAFMLIAFGQLSRLAIHFMRSQK